MGNNTSTSVKSALALSNAKRKLGRTFESSERSATIENPETAREKKLRHKQRDADFEKKKKERERKTALLQRKWSENKARMNHTTK